MPITSRGIGRNGLRAGTRTSECGDKRPEGGSDTCDAGNPSPVRHARSPATTCSETPSARCSAGPTRTHKTARSPSPPPSSRVGSLYGGRSLRLGDGFVPLPSTPALKSQKSASDLRKRGLCPIFPAPSRRRFGHAAGTTERPDGERKGGGRSRRSRGCERPARRARPRCRMRRHEGAGRSRRPGRRPPSSPYASASSAPR